MEKHLRRSSRGQSAVSSQSTKEDLVKAVQEAKRAREEALREDEVTSDTHTPSGGDFIYKPNNQNGVVPNLVIHDGDREDNCNDAEVGEKAKMLRKYSIDNDKLGSKAKIFSPLEQNGPGLPKHKGMLSSIPPHMRKEILNGQVRSMNNSLPDVKMQCAKEESVPLAGTEGMLQPEEGDKKSYSHADIQFLSVAPRRKKSEEFCCVFS